MKNQELYKKAIETWGKDAQTGVAIEELAELIVAIQHFRRGKADKTAVLSEIADVEIMCEQLKLIFDDAGEVNKIKETKIDKLTKRLKLHK